MHFDEYWVSDVSLNILIFFFSGLSQVSVVRLQVQPVALSGPLRLHPILSRQARLHRRLRPLRLVQRSRRLFGSHRTQTSRPRTCAERYEILLGRFVEHVSRLFRTSRPNRAGNVLYGFGHPGRRRALVFRPGRPLRSRRQFGLVPVPVFVRVDQRHRRSGRADPGFDILRPGSASSDAFARG